jgi:hypothetical protein
VLVSAAFLLWFPKAAEPVLHFREVFAGTFRSVVQTSKQPQVPEGFLLFLMSVSCMAAINTFAGLGRRVALTSAAGALPGGYIADRVDSRRLICEQRPDGRRDRAGDGADSAHSAFLHNRRAGV